MGTPDFLSPEACEGDPIDERGDIWSFGVLLFAMLTGEAPFPGDSLTAKLTAILTQAVPDLAQRCPDAPEALVDLVYRMLEKDREKRANYVLPVKENQLRLLETLQRLCDDPEEMRCVECDSFRTIEKGPTPPSLCLILSAMAANHRQGACGPS